MKFDSFHKLQDGDIIKILPFINKDGSISTYKQYHVAYSSGISGSGAGSKKIIDTEGKYLKRIAHYTGNNKIVQTKYAFNIYINGEIKIMTVGKSIFDIITDNIGNGILDIRKNLHLFIKMKMAKAGVNVYPDFKHSLICEHNWTPPVSDINSKEEWEKFIINNQPNLEEYFESNSIYNNIKLLDEMFGKNDILSIIISEIREKKIGSIID